MEVGTKTNSGGSVLVGFESVWTTVTLERLVGLSAVPYNHHRALKHGGSDGWMGECESRMQTIALVEKLRALHVRGQVQWQEVCGI